VLATPGQVRQAEERAQARRRREEAARRDAEAVADRIRGVTLRFEARVGELDRLYGSVTSADIADKLTAQTGIAVERRKIDLDEPIKRIGVYPVKVRLAAGLEPMINVVVEGEGRPATEAPAPEAAESELPELEPETD
jgi:large subunit ribosomal protein L9